MKLRQVNHIIILGISFLVFSCSQEQKKEFEESSTFLSKDDPNYSEEGEEMLRNMQEK